MDEGVRDLGGLGETVLCVWLSVGSLVGIAVCAGDGCSMGADSGVLVGWGTCEWAGTGVVIFVAYCRLDAGSCNPGECTEAKVGGLGDGSLLRCGWL